MFPYFIKAPIGRIDGAAEIRSSVELNFATFESSKLKITYEDDGCGITIKVILSRIDENEETIVEYSSYDEPIGPI